MKDCNFCNERVHEIFALEHAFSLSFAKPGCKNGFFSFSLSHFATQQEKFDIFHRENKHSSLRENPLAKKMTILDQK
jgi:hypothetical protein